MAVMAITTKILQTCIYIKCIYPFQTEGKTCFNAFETIFLPSHHKPITLKTVGRKQPAQKPIIISSHEFSVRHVGSCRYKKIVCFHCHSVSLDSF